MNRDDAPKVYSNLEFDDCRPRPLPTSRCINDSLPQPPRPSQYCSKNASSIHPPKYSAPKTNNEFLNLVYAKLKEIEVSEGDRDKDARSTLNMHYNSTIRIPRQKKDEYKVYIRYIRFDERGAPSPHKDVYVVRVDHNTLRKVKDKLPNYRSNMRFFFKAARSELYYEEELDNNLIEYTEKNGMRFIHCEVHLP